MSTSNSKWKLFNGPGLYLIIPMERVINNNCNHVDFPIGDYKNPPCICVYPDLRVPFGCEYRIDPHPEWRLPSQGYYMLLPENAYG